MFHYFHTRPAYRRLRVRRFSTNIRGFSLTFVTASGVFSREGIDRGTRLLAENMIVEDGWTILDLCCGYGVLGIVAAKLAPHGIVYMTDINELAVRLAKINARINNVRSVKVRRGDLFEPVRGLKFNTIITNPPISAGMDLNLRLIRESIDHLVDGGILQIVFPSNVADRLAGEIESVYGNVELLARTSTHKAYVASKV